MRTLQQIKDSLPAYRYLSPSELYAETDNWLELLYDEITDRCSEHWRPVPAEWVGKRISKYWQDGEFSCQTYCVARRPIPSEVLESQAFFCMWAIVANVPARLDLDRWELHMHNGGLTASFNEGFSYRERQIGEYELHQRNGFESEAKALEAIPLLGGEQNIIKHLSQGDLYSVWSGEQLK